MATIKDWDDEMKNFEGLEGIDDLIGIKRALDVLIGWDFFAEEFDRKSLLNVQTLVTERMAEIDKL